VEIKIRPKLFLLIITRLPPSANEANIELKEVRISKSLDGLGKIIFANM
jgi:hypothetical protein